MKKSLSTLLTTLVVISLLLNPFSTIRVVAKSDVAPLFAVCAFTQTGNYDYNHSSVDYSQEFGLGVVYKGGDAYMSWKGTLRFSFTGERLQIIYHYFWRNPSGFFISIDGVSHGYLNTSGSDENTIRYWSSPQLGKGTHSVVLTYQPPYHTSFSGYRTYRCTDQTPPTLGFAGAVNNAWRATNVTITPNSFDGPPDASGIAAQYVGTQMGSWVSSLSLTSSSDVYCYARDVANNVAQAKCGRVNIDKIAPTVGFSGAVSNVWRPTDAVITPNCSDGQSGLASQFVSDTLGSWRSSFTVSQTSDIYCQATDNVGNIKQQLCGTVLIDKEAPPLPDLPVVETNSVINSSQTANNSPSFSWEQSEQDIGSGIEGYDVCWGDASCPSSGTIVHTTQPTYAPPIFGTGAETKYLHVRTVDHVGNASPWEIGFTYHFNPSVQGALAITEENGVVSQSAQTSVYSPTFTWTPATDPVEGITHYQVYWGSDPLPLLPSPDSPTIPVTEPLTFSPTAFDPELDATRYFRVFAYNSSGFWMASDVFPVYLPGSGNFDGA